MAVAVTSHTAIGLVLLAITFGFGFYLLDNYSPGSRMFSIGGTTLQLTEFEDDDRDYGHSSEHDHDED